MRITAVCFLSLTTLSIAVLSGCQSRPESGTGPAGNTAAPTLDELRNATYVGLEVAGDTVALRNGRWLGKPYGTGGAVRPTATYARDLRLVGDLDGDGVEEAVAFVAYSGGGSGDFLSIAVMAQRAGVLRQVATALVGDRVQVRGARIENRAITLDLVQAGPADAACCPGDLVTRAWTLAGDSLVEREPEAATGRLSPDVIGPGEWTLEAWDLDQPATSAPGVTISYQAGKLAGRSGCNRYSARIKAGDLPGDVTIGPAAGTRMACPPPAMETEQRFLAALGGTSKIGFFAGRLALTYRTEKGLGTMLFASGAAAGPAATPSASR